MKSVCCPVFVKHLTRHTNKHGSFPLANETKSLSLAFRSSGPKYPLQSTGNHSFLFMRRRGRIAFANPLVLGGPVKNSSQVIHWCGAVSCAFLIGILFTLWILLAWVIPTLCSGLQWMWSQKLTFNAGKIPIFGSWQLSSVLAVLDPIWSPSVTWTSQTGAILGPLVLHLQLK